RLPPVLQGTPIPTNIANAMNTAASNTKRLFSARRSRTATQQLECRSVQAEAYKGRNGIRKKSIGAPYHPDWGQRNPPHWRQSGLAPFRKTVFEGADKSDRP